MDVSIHDIWAKIKGASSGRVGKTALIIILFVIANIASYMLGSSNNVSETTSPVIIAGNVKSYDEAISTVNLGTGIVFASKNGTKFYYDNCSGGKSIKTENRIWFEKEEEARAAGYTLATNCSPK
jgi:hypothetical protein